MEKYLASIDEHSSRMFGKAVKHQTDSFEELPARLHHYLPSVEVLVSILSNREMWASHAYDMADQKELRFGAELLLERIDIFKDKYGGQRWAIDQFFEMAADVANPFTNSYTGDRDAFILSLTVNGDSPHHWEHYAGHGEGCCLDFDITPGDWPKWMREQNLQLIRVRYDRVKQTALIDELLKEQVQFIISCGDSLEALTAGMSASVTAVMVLEYYVMSFKRGNPDEFDYSAEDEWRLVYGMREDPRVLAVKPKPNNKGRYVPISLDVMRGFVTLGDVRAGPNAAPDAAAEAEKLLSLYSNSPAKPVGASLYSVSRRQ